MREIRHQVLEHLRSGSGIVLATVIRKSGSAPQVPGASALFDSDGLVAGTIGGGLMEAEVLQIAKKALQSGVSDRYTFDLDEGGPDGAICGGKATVLVDARPLDHLNEFERMEEDLSLKKEGCMLTIVSAGENIGKNIRRSWLTRKGLGQPIAGLDHVTDASIREELDHISFGEFMEIPLSAGDDLIAYLEPVKPLPRLVIAGAGHVGRAVAHLGKWLQFEVTVIDDREEYVNPRNLPDADHLLVRNFSDIFEGIDPDGDTYVVIVTRGHGHDADVLRKCIASDAAYIGMIGSSRKVAHLKGELLERGWSTREQWERIHTPIGIEINSKTVEEIAVSIAAQLVAVRNGPHSRPRGKDISEHSSDG
ncbi:MAG: XdhC/CoxI family protein [Bacteroidetes bacterium]|nr:MAG: XdhC/CoxI family protein [Bacteroidota bacterium]